MSDAISRADDSRARAEGWTRVATPVDDIMDVLGRAASDIDFACHSAPERLLDFSGLVGTDAVWGVGAPGGRRSAHPGPRHRGFGAVRLAGRTTALRPKRALLHLFV